MLFLLKILLYWVIFREVFTDEVQKLSADVCLYVHTGKWFEPRSLSRLCGLIVRVRVVPRRTVVGDIDICSYCRVDC